MNNYLKKCIYVLTGCAILNCGFYIVLAQDDDDFYGDDDMELEEMDEEEWQRSTDELSTRRNDLQNQLAYLYNEVELLKKQMQQKDIEINNAKNNLYTLVNASESDVALFRVNFELLEKRINDKEYNQNNIMEDFKNVESSKIKCLPEFTGRYEILKGKLSSWSPNVLVYTVARGDCLWKIAKEMYGNGVDWIEIVRNNSEIFSYENQETILYEGESLKLSSITKHKAVCLDEHIDLSAWCDKGRAKQFISTHLEKTKPDQHRTDVIDTTYYPKKFNK